MRHLRILFASVLLSAVMMVLTTPTHAIPIAGDYTLTSTNLNGTFTSDGTALTAWSFDTLPATVNFTQLTPFVNNNDAISFQQNNAANFPAIRINWNSTMLSSIETVVIFGIGGGSGDGMATATPTAVPEPSTVLLFAVGLVGLAGSRWHQRRREGVQTT